MALKSRDYMTRYNAKFKAKHGISPVTSWRRNNKEAAKKHRERERKRWLNNPSVRIHHSKATKKHREKMRNICLDGYGNKCNCCNTSIRSFLNFDHVNRDGGKHRKEMKITGTRLYTWIIEHNFPDSIQLLCWNCNLGREQHSGICPHKIKDWQ